MISTNLRIIAIVGSLALLLFIVELVRRRRLKEEYSVLWVTTAVVLLALAAWSGLLRDLTHFIGAISQASTLYFFSIIFIVFLLLHFSVRVSNLERRVVVLLQEIALLNERELRSERRNGHGPAALGEDLGAGARAGPAARGGGADPDAAAAGRKASPR
jgi:hypothetical protein